MVSADRLLRDKIGDTGRIEKDPVIVQAFHIDASIGTQVHMIWIVRIDPKSMAPLWTHPIELFLWNYILRHHWIDTVKAGR